MSKEKDSFGDAFVVEMLKKAASGGGWHSYQWRHASKSSYVKMMVKDGKKLMGGSGFYPHSKVDLVVGLVKGAVAFFNDRTAKGVRPVEIVSNFHYSLGDFVIGDIALFVFNKDVIALANGNESAEAGQSLYDTKDEKGAFFSRNMVNTMKEVALGEGHWFKYQWSGMERLAYVERVVDAAGISRIS